jgi:hypothetical protein
VGWHLDLFKKLVKVWRRLHFPDDGWRDWPGSRRDQCTLATVESKHGKRASETTLRHRAQRIDRHILEPRNELARVWLQQILDQHREASTADQPAFSHRLSARPMTIAEAYEALQTGQMPSTVEDQPIFSEKPMRASEWIWYQCLRDACTMEAFDFLFGFGGRSEDIAAPPEMLARGAGHGADALQVVQDIWRSDLTAPSHLRRQWPGRYIFYRVDPHDFEQALVTSSGRTSSAAHGWFGCLRVLRVPVALTLVDDLLTWHDVFPDPSYGPYESIGLLSAASDGSVDVFGYDPFAPSHRSKFLISMMRTRANGVRGVIFSREKASVGIACYRVWLQQAETDEEYRAISAEVSRLNGMFANRATVAEKWRAYRESDILFQSVSDLMRAGEHSMISYLFAPPGITEADLAQPRKVKAIKPFPLSHVFFEADLEPSDEPPKRRRRQGGARKRRD